MTRSPTLLDHYREAGIENILALAGDPRADGQPEASDYRYAIELLEDVVAAGCFAVGGRRPPAGAPALGRPGLRPAPPRRQAARRRLRHHPVLLRGRATTSGCVDELAALGVDKPILPGIMPITNAGQVKRMADMSGARVPGWLAERLDAIDDPDEVRRSASSVATTLCAELLDAGAPGLHFYTLNRSTRELARSTPTSDLASR